MVGAARRGYAERVLRAGAHGFVNKQTSVGSIPDAIRQIISGSFAFSPLAQDHLCASLVSRTTAGDSATPALSDRELEVGTLIGAGASTREIAERLHLSVKTVETHRARMKQKLSLPNTARLAQFWLTWDANGADGNHPVGFAGLGGNGSHAGVARVPIYQGPSPVANDG